MGRVCTRFERVIQITVWNECLGILVSCWIEVECILIDRKDGICWNEVVLVYDVVRAVVGASDADPLY